MVTGHDASGRAVVKIDDVLQGKQTRPSAAAAVIWTTESFPVDNSGDQDEAQRQVGTTLANGTVFRVLELNPGNAARVHRTDSIDYAVVMSGEIDMELEQLPQRAVGMVEPATACICRRVPRSLRKGTSAAADADAERPACVYAPDRGRLRPSSWRTQPNMGRYAGT